MENINHIMSPPSVNSQQHLNEPTSNMNNNKKLYFKQSATEALHSAILLKARNPTNNLQNNVNNLQALKSTETASNNKILLLNPKWTNQNNLVTLSSSSNLLSMPPVINISDDSQSSNSATDSISTNNNSNNSNYSDELDSPFKIKENILASIRNLKPALAGLSSSTSDDDDEELNNDLLNDLLQNEHNHQLNDVIVIGSQTLPNVVNNSANNNNNGMVKLTIPASNLPPPPIVSNSSSSHNVQRHSYLRTNTCYAKLNSATMSTVSLNNTPKLPSAFNEMKLCFNNSNSTTTTPQLTSTPPIILTKTASSSSSSSLLLSKSQLNKINNVSSKRGKEEALSNSSSSDEETDLQQQQQQRINNNNNQKLQLILNNSNSLKSFMNNNKSQQQQNNLLTITAQQQSSWVPNKTDQQPYITPVVSAAAAAAAAATANLTSTSTNTSIATSSVLSSSSSSYNTSDSDLINSPSSMSSNKSDSDYGSLLTNNLSFSISSPTSCCSSSNSSSCTTNDSSSAIDLNDDNSSTASGPIYVRQPGFEFHAHEVQIGNTMVNNMNQILEQKQPIKSLGRSNKKAAVCDSTVKPVNAKVNTKAKKKLCMMLNTDSLSSTTTTIKNNEQPERQNNPNVQLKPISNKAKRDPLPMRLRALPPSFWQQPNQPNATLSTMYLPPLFKNEIIEPVIDDSDNCNINGLNEDLNNNNNFTNNNKLGMFDSIQNYREVKISPANTDLLFKLFDNIEQKDKKQMQQLQLQFKTNRLNTKQPLKGLSKALIKGEDPCIVDAVTEGLFPLLRLDSRTETVQFLTLKSTNDCLISNLSSNGLSNSSPVLCNPNTSNMITNNSNTLPSLQFEQNYSQALSEVVAAL